MRLLAFTAVNSKRGTKLERSDYYPFRRPEQAAKPALMRELSKVGNIVVKGSAP